MTEGYPSGELEQRTTEQQIRWRIREAARRAVMAEREACAMLAESFTDIIDRWRIARAIRMR